MFRLQANDGAEAAPTVNDLSSDETLRSRFGRLAHVLHAEAVARQRRAVDVDSPFSRAGQDLALNVGGPRYLGQQGGHFVGQPLQFVGVGPEDLHRHIGPNARYGLIQAHRHRLSEVVPDAWKVIERRR